MPSNLEMSNLCDSNNRVFLDYLLCAYPYTEDTTVNPDTIPLLELDSSVG